MKKKRDKISCQIPRVTLLGVQVRLKKNELKNDEEYAVLKVSFVDTFDGHALAWKSRKVPKTFTVMCFRDEVWKRLIETHAFSFTGFVSLKYGGVYFVVEKAFDELDFDVERRESMYFTNYSEMSIVEAMAFLSPDDSLEKSHSDEVDSQHT
jgi:hypothetical protein